MISKILILSCLALVVSGASIQEEADTSATGDKVYFYLYNQASQIGTIEGHQLKIENDSTFENTGISPGERLVILVHGFLQDYRCDFPQDIKDKYVELNQGINVINVDWGSIACQGWSETLSPLCYPSAVGAIKAVGEKIADLIGVLQHKGLVTIENVHVVGLSLGAHVAGHVGNAVLSANGAKIARITGLDPAGPLFTCNAGARCLNKDDADFVDVVHSDMGVLGTSKALGQIDFYPNGGKATQPSCEGQSTKCSHLASTAVWMSSIGNSNIKAYKCASYDELTQGNCDKSGAVTFGDDATPGSTGAYYLSIYPAEFSGRYICFA